MSEKGASGTPNRGEGGRIAPLSASDLSSEEARSVMDRILQRRGGELRPLDQLLLHSPEVANGWNALLGAVRGQLSLPDALRELIILRVAVLNGAEYEWLAHLPVAAAAGLTQPKLSALRGAITAEDFDAKEQALLAYCDAVTTSVQVPNPVFDALRGFFGPREIVELTTTIATYNMVSRLLVALRVPLPAKAPEAVGDSTWPSLGATEKSERTFGQAEETFEERWSAPRMRPGQLGGRLNGKIAVITGAGSVGPGWGNGRAVAVLFAREGARVVLLDRDRDALAATAEMVRREGGDPVTLTCDVTSSEDLTRVVATASDEVGSPTVLVNNVGGSHPGGVLELSEDDWHRQIDSNLTSAFLCCKHFAPGMIANGGGAIVNIASASGIRWTGAPQVAYASAKAGLIQLSRVVAVQHAADGIRANTVIAGQLHTPMVEARLAGQRAGGDVDALLEQRKRRVPLSFMGDGRDTAYAALFLASDEARFVTGAELLVDGGMTVRCD